MNETQKTTTTKMEEQLTRLESDHTGEIILDGGKLEFVAVNKQHLQDFLDDFLNDDIELVFADGGLYLARRYDTYSEFVRLYTMPEFSERRVFITNDSLGWDRLKEWIKDIKDKTRH